MHQEAGWFPIPINQEHRLLSRAVFASHKISVPPSVIIEGFTTGEGTVDVDCLRDALRDLALHHSALRSRILLNPYLSPQEHLRRLSDFARTGIVIPGAYRQQLDEESDAEIKHHDVSGLTGLDRRTAISQICENEAKQLDLSRPPHIRPLLIRFDAHKELLILIINHFISDAWSTQIIQRDLCTLYTGNCLKIHPILSPVEMSYEQFASWQDEALHVGRFDHSIRYWQEYWAKWGSARVMQKELPFAYPPTQPHIPDSVYGSERHNLSAQLSDAIRATARTERITFYSVYLAAFLIVLWRYTHKARLSLWCYFYNRTTPRLRNTVGFLTTRHILGIEVERTTRVAALLRIVHS